MSDAPKSSSFRERGGAWVVVQFVFIFAVLILAVVFRGDWSRIWMTIAGAFLFVIGGWFGIAGNRALGKSRTPFPKPQESCPLIQHGIYARVRHPLYTSVMLLSLGWALIWQSWPAIVVALAQIPFFVAKARREECWLREKFPEYADYEKRVPRFVPDLRPRHRAF
jgi:protein-S-isoprenylcysteine O-methyltransferase Ste14